MSQNMDFTIANVAGLRSFAVPADAGTTPTTANLQGYYTAGDRGGGCFDYNASSTATDDGFSTIEPSAGSGRWIRRIDAWNIDMRMAGAVANGISDDTSAHYAIMNWAGAGGGYTSTGGAIGNPIAVRIQYSAGQTIYFGSGGNVLFGASAAGYLSGSVFEGVDAGMVRPNQNNTFYPLDGIQLAPGTYTKTHCA